MTKAKTALTIRRMQIKATVRGHYIHSPMTKRNILTIPSADRDAQALYLRLFGGDHCGTLENRWAVSYEVKQILALWLNNLTPGYLP